MFPKMSLPERATSTTPVSGGGGMEAPAGFEPANAGFAVPCLTNLATVPRGTGRYRGAGPASRSPLPRVEPRDPSLCPDRPAFRSEQRDGVVARADGVPSPPQLRVVGARNSGDDDARIRQERHRRAVARRSRTRRPGGAAVVRGREGAGALRSAVIAAG